MALAYVPHADEFLAYLKAVTPSPRTVMTYGAALPRLDAFLGINGVQVLAAPRAMLQDFVVWLGGKGLGARSVRTVYYGVHRYIAWLRNRETVPDFAEPDLPRVVHTQLLTFRTDEEIAEYLRALDNTPDLREPVLNVMRLWPFCGLRLAEMVALRREDVGDTVVETASGPVVWRVLKIIHAKGGKHREVGVLPPGARVLDYHTKAWLEQKRPETVFLWPSRRGKVKPIHRDSVMEAFTKVSFVMRKRVTSHCMRRTYATLLYRMGVPIETVSVMLGHKNVQTTLDFYVQIGLGDHLQKMSLGLKGQGPWKN